MADQPMQHSVRSACGHRPVTGWSLGGLGDSPMSVETLTYAPPAENLTRCRPGACQAAPGSPHRDFD